MAEALLLAHSELILGGQKSGKSVRAERLAAAWLAQHPGHRAVLVATAEAWDDEMRERIARHQRERAQRVPGLRTVEEADDLAGVIAHESRADTLLVVDCLTLWLTRLTMPMQGPACSDADLQCRVQALVGIAPAPDFTEDLMWAEFTSDQRAAIERDGLWMRPSDYGNPYPITRALIEDGRRHLLLRGPLALDAPVRILQGMADPDVPWRHALRIAEALTGGDVQVSLVKDGDHRLSRPQDLALLGGTLAPLLREDGG